MNFVEASVVDEPYIETRDGRSLRRGQLLSGEGRLRAIGVTILALLLLAASIPDSALLAQDAPETWEVSRQPVVRIGMVTGPEEYLFQAIREIVALPGGRLAVADAGYLTIRVYDADGRYLHRMGTQGEGPGEFLSISGLWLTEDGELAVWDHELRRVVRFTQAGAHVETTQIVHPDDRMGNLQRFLGRMSGGEVLLAALSGRVRSDGERSPSSNLLFRYHLSGEFRAAVGQIEGMWFYRGGGSVVTLPFTPVPSVVTWNDTIYVAVGYEPEVEVRDRDGARVRAIPVPGQREPTGSDWAAFQRALRERADDLPVGPFLVNFLERGEMPLDGRMPATAGLLVDDAGLIWAKAFRPAEDSRWLRAHASLPAPGGEWWVLDPALGVTVARVELPPTVVPLVIRDGKIIGKDVDALGVERVVVHELRRGGS